MKLKVLVASVLISIVLPSLSWAKRRCADQFTTIELMRSNDLGFSQESLGILWALNKTSEYSKKLEAQTKQRTFRVREALVLSTTKTKPLPAFRDIEGKVRLHDRHHRFYAISAFMGAVKSFRLYVSVDKDYTQINDATKKPWTEKEMMADLVANNYIHLSSKAEPTFADLRALPTDIFSVQNNPLRSGIGFILASLEVPLKSEDFNSKFQFLLIDVAMTYGIDVAKVDFLVPEAAKAAGEEILSMPPLVEFLLDNISARTSPERLGVISGFLNGKLESAIQKNPDWEKEIEEVISLFD